MWVIAGIRDNQNFTISSIVDLSVDELKQILSVLHDANNFTRRHLVNESHPTYDFLAVNFQADKGNECSYYPKDGRKISAQTLPWLHIHQGILRGDDLELFSGELTKEERVLRFDPFLPLIRALVNIPSVQDDLFSKLGSSIRFKQVTNTGFEFYPVDILDSNFSKSLQRLHAGYEHWYGLLANCFKDEKGLLNKDSLKEEVRQLIHNLVTDPLNINSIDKITHFEKILLWLGNNFHPRVYDKRDMYILPTCAYTLSLWGQDASSRKKLILSPRVASTGNAMDAFPVVKRSTDCTVEARKQHHDYLDAMQLFTLFNGFGNLC